MLKIAVIDGQGGSVGREIIEAIRREIYWDIQLIALGTNSLATSAMVRAGANLGETGENAIVLAVPRVDLILGSMGIIAADAMNGEITASMACAITECLTMKMLIPLSRCNIEIAGIDQTLSRSQLIEKMVRMVKVIYDQEKQGRQQVQQFTK